MSKKLKKPGLDKILNIYLNACKEMMQWNCILWSVIELYLVLLIYFNEKNKKN